MTASDSVLEDVKLLAIYIDNVNEKPYFVANQQLGNILESETKSRVVLDMDSLDPENDALVYAIIGSSPSGAPFSIDSTTGRFYLNLFFSHISRTQVVCVEYFCYYRWNCLSYDVNITSCQANYDRIKSYDR